MDRPAGRVRRAKRAVLLLAALGCTGTLGCLHKGYRSCAEPSPERLAEEPERLSKTGLFKDTRAQVLAEGVMPYRPRFELWSDGATKRRWVLLPDGAKIDSKDPDDWRFPVGTKLWKEFTRDGVRLETRLLHKVGPADVDWSAVAYVWDDDGTDARVAPEGLENAKGTQHDVPAARLCMGCHGGTASRVLGFGAIQLAHAAPKEEASLEELVANGRLTVNPSASLELPGDATTQAALGYLHANCAHCHNQRRPKVEGPRCYDPKKQIDLSLRVAELATLASTAVYRTALGQITPGAPEASNLLGRMHHDGFFLRRMPPLASERIDERGEAVVAAWIGAMKAAPPR